MVISVMYANFSLDANDAWSGFPHAPLGKQRGYRYLSWIVIEDTGYIYRIEHIDDHGNSIFFVRGFFVLNSEQWHLELFRRGRRHPAWVRSRVYSCVSYTRGRRLYLFLCSSFFLFWPEYTVGLRFVRQMTISPGGILGLIFAGYVPLVS